VLLSEWEEKKAYAHSSSSARPPRHASHTRTRCVAWIEFETHFCRRQLFFLVHQLSLVRVECVCACSPRVPGFYAWRCGRRLCSQTILGDQPDPERAFLLSLSRSSFCCCPLVFPIPATACRAIRESRPPKPRPLRSCTERHAIRFLGSVSAWLLASVHVLPRQSASSSGSATSTLPHGRQPWWSCCYGGSDLPSRTIRSSNLILSTSYGFICGSARCLCMSACG
jgi:hypothetical protein